MIIFVNGYTLGCQPIRPYWSSSKNSNEFIDAACNYFQDSYNDDESFVNGSGKWFGSLASFRYAAGKKYALGKLETYKALLTPNEKLNIISHSMGAAFAEGMIDVFCQHQLPIGKIIHFAPAHARKIKISPATINLLRIQLNASEDTIIERFSDPFIRGKKLLIPGVNLYGKVHWNPWLYHPKHMAYVQQMNRKHQQHPHFDLKTYAFVFDWLSDLETLSHANKQDQHSINTKFEAVYMHGKYFELM
jgi:predicted alpha/beta hydrolase family esterase